VKSLQTNDRTTPSDDNNPQNIGLIDLLSHFSNVINKTLEHMTEIIEKQVIFHDTMINL
jgi:hypothetical protein